MLNMLRFDSRESNGIGPRECHNRFYYCFINDTISCVKFSEFREPRVGEETFDV